MAEGNGNRSAETSRETEPLLPSQQPREHSDRQSDGRPGIVLFPENLRDMDNDRYYDAERMNVWVMNAPNYGIDIRHPSTSNDGLALPPPLPYDHGIDVCKPSTSNFRAVSRPAYSSVTPDDNSSFYMVTPQMMVFAETVRSLMWFLFAILLVNAIAIICISYQSPGICLCLGISSWNALQVGYALLFISAVVPNICHVLWIRHETRPLVKDAVYFASTVFYISTAIIIDSRLYLCNKLLAQVAFCFTTVSILFTLGILVLLLYELFTVRCHTRNYF